MVSVITGASGGIGEAIARELARRQFDVVVVARSADKLAHLAAELEREQHVRAHVVVADLAAPGAAGNVAHRAREVAGRVDVLVNNAGFGVRGPFRDIDVAIDLEMIRVNVEALTELTKRLLPDLVATRGRILNVASTAAFQPGPLMAVYYATKAYVLSFSEALAEELAWSHVTVTCLCPGPTRSGFQARAHLEGARLFSAGLMSTEAVARRGVDGLLSGRRVVIPGVVNWLGAEATRLTPRRLLAKLVYWLHTSGQRAEGK